MIVMIPKMKKDFEWLRKIISNPTNQTAHYESLKRLTILFSKKWSHIKKEHPDLYWSYVNYLHLQLRFEFYEE